MLHTNFVILTGLVLSLLSGRYLPGISSILVVGIVVLVYLATQQPSATSPTIHMDIADFH